MKNKKRSKKDLLITSILILYTIFSIIAIIEHQTTLGNAILEFVMYEAIGIGIYAGLKNTSFEMIQEIFRD